MAVTQYAATGRRKSSVARVRLVPGNGKFVINTPQTTNHEQRKGETNMKKLDRNMIFNRTNAMAHEGYTLAEVCNELQVCETTVRTAVHVHYEKSGGVDSAYTKKLFKLFSANARAQKKQKLTSEIHLVETGYILAVGISALETLVASGNVAMPLFCFDELHKLAEKYTVAEQFFRLKIHEKVTALLLKEETLYVEPAEDMTKRVIGVVAQAVDLASLGKQVVIHTNSSKIKALAEMQGDEDMSVELVR
jgi:hypothetical protein